MVYMEWPTARAQLCPGRKAALIEGRGGPNLAMMSVSDGDQHYIVRPDNMLRFLVLHLSADCHFVCHNVAFDFRFMIGFFPAKGIGSPDGCGRRWIRTECINSMLLAG